jgi:hemolysin-activating ACP:hemolysin acyltransferase
MASYTWKIAERTDFPAIYSLLYNSELKSKWGVDDVRRRVGVPLILGQLITIYDEAKKLVGFLTCAFMNKESAEHQGTVGVLPEDWRSGSDFWVVDYFASNGDGRKMLTTVMRDLDRAMVRQVNYFRLKYQQIRKVKPA